MNTVIKTKRSVINNKDCGSSSLKINRTNEIREWLIDRQPLKVGTDQEGAKLFGRTPSAIEHIRNRLGLHIQKPERSSKVNEKSSKVSVTEFAEGLLERMIVNPLTTLPSIPMPTIKRSDGDEEEVVLMLSDWQIGHKTRSFNLGVAKERVIKLAQVLFKITALHRKAYPIRKLNLFLEGDFVQSEKVGWLVDLSELESILIDQVFEGAVPLLKWFISECTKHFQQVNVYCVRGNHGRGEKQSSEKTNWDDVIYKCLEQMFASNTRVKFCVAREFYQFVEISNVKFLLVHGDQVKGGSYGIPLYALLQRMLRWGTSMPEKWDVLCVGHWHCFGHIEQNGQDLIVNGTLVSDDEYVRKQYGWNASTIQVLFGVHPRQGITWEYRCKLNGKKS